MSEDKNRMPIDDEELVSVNGGSRQAGDSEEDLKKAEFDKAWADLNLDQNPNVTGHLRAELYDHWLREVNVPALLYLTKQKL